MVCCNKPQAFRRICLALLIGFTLIGCGGNVKPEKPSTELAPDAVSLDPDVPFTAIPDPYLAQAKVPSAAAQRSFSAAIKAMQAQNWPAAHQSLVAMTEAYPDLSGPWVNLGIVESRLGDLEAAERALAKAIEINPLNNDAYNQAALLMREQGKFSEAEQLYKKALAVWPHSFESNRNIGILYDLYMGKFDLAMKHYELASKLAPEDDRELKGWIVDLKRRLQQ